MTYPTTPESVSHNQVCPSAKRGQGSPISIHSVTASSISDIVMRSVFSGSEPMRFDATSANKAVAVHDTATPNAIVSPINITTD